MTQPKGIADHPQKDEMQQMWEEGFKARAIMDWLQENEYYQPKMSTLARFGQRNWVETEEDPDGAVETVLGASKLIQEIQGMGLGNIERITVSKTGYSLGVKPTEAPPAELEHLPRVGKPIPKIRRVAAADDIITHVFIPDTQVEPGRGTDHLLWTSRYLYDRYHGKPLTVVMGGDHWNMGSLSSYDRGKGAMEGRRYMADIDAGNRGFEVLDSQIADEPLWDKHIIFGNHEHRINRAVEDDIRLEGLLTLDHCITPESWERHDFLVPVTLDGVTYAHYFYNPNTSRPYGGENMELRLKTLGHSFVMGHQQGLKMGMRYVNGVQQVGVVAGSCYTHDEDYMGPQGNAHWRGIVVLNNVENGSFDPMPVSLDYLCRRYEGHRLKDHTPVII